MATLPILRYELDPTGTSPDNLVQGELHTTPARQIRAVAPTYGAFFSASMRVRDTSNNQLLTKGVQYYPAELYEIPTAKFGKEVCAIIVITDASVSNNISLEYQAVGGEFSSAATAVVQQIEALNLDDRPIEWGSVIEKPSEYPPSHHLHDAGDIYGFEYLVHAIDRVRAAILMGDDLSHETIYQYIDNIRAAIQAVADGAAAAVLAHVNDRDNPHQVTLAQLNAYNKGEVDALVNLARSDLSIMLEQHVLRHDNPHVVTKAQVGLGNVNDFPMATFAEAVAVASNEHYMSPLRVGQALAQHSASAAHDERYVRLGATVSCSLTESGGYLYAWVSGAWRAIWPPQWQE